MDAAEEFKSVSNVLVQWFTEAIEVINQKLDLSDSLFVDVKQIGIFPAKRWFLKQALREIEKFTAGWEQGKHLSNSNVEGNFERLQHDQLTFHTRKLKEVLAKLILFKSTDEEHFYHHYILIEEYAFKHEVINHMKQYFDCENIELETQLNNFEIALGTLESQNDFSTAWYKSGSRKLKRERNVIDEALKITSAINRSSLGYFYSSYALESGKVHANFGATLTRFSGNYEDIRLHLSLTAMRVVVSIADLLNLNSNDKIRRIRDFSERDSFRQSSEENTTALLRVGDIVDIGGCLAVVKETGQGVIGYRKYLVEFTNECRVAGVQEDWYATSMVHFVITEKDFEKNIKKRLKKVFGDRYFSNNEIHKRKFSILSKIKSTNKQFTSSEELQTLFASGGLDGAISEVFS